MKDEIIQLFNDINSSYTIQVERDDKLLEFELKLQSLKFENVVSTIFEEDNQKLENNTKNITNKTYKNNADNEKKDKNFKSKWKKLSKLAKSAILVPVIYFVPAIIVTILANVIKTPSMIATLMTIQLITLCFAGGIFIFEAVAIGILLYRKHKKDFEKIIKNNK